MLKIKKVKSIISISMLVTANFLTAFSAQAEIDYITCNSCSDNRMKLSAEATQENKIVNVVDFSNFTTRSYLVFNEPGHSSAREVSAHPDLLSGIIDLKDAKAYIDEALSNNDVNIDDLKGFLLNKDSASDFIKVIRFEDRQRDIAEALGKYIGGSLKPDALKNLAAIFSAAAVSKAAMPLSYNIRVKFGDNYLAYQFTGLTLTNDTLVATFKPLPSSGRIGDIVLSTTSGYGFRLYGSGVDVITALEGMGFNINYGSSSRTQVSSGTATIGCSGSKAKPCFVID